MKKVLSLILVFVMILPIRFSSFANSNNVPSERITKVVLQVGNKLYELDPQNYENEIEEILTRVAVEKTTNYYPPIEPHGMTDDWSRYDEDSTGTETRYDLQSIFSNVVYNDANNTSNYSVSCSKTVGWNIDASAEYELNSVKTGMSIGWNSSESYTDTISVSVSPNHYGWVEIAPIMDYSKGVYKVFSWLGKIKSTSDVTIWVPRRNKPNYIFITKESTTPPVS